MKPKLTLKALYMLDVIDREGGLTAASRVLCKTPTALTHALSTLEYSLGVPLFFRKNRRMILTPVGRTLVNKGRGILDACTELEAEVESLKLPTQHPVRISFEPIIPFCVISRVITEHQANTEKLNVKINQIKIGRAHSAIRWEQCDLSLGVDLRPEKRSCYEKFQIGNLQMVIAIPKALYGAIQSTDLSQEHIPSVPFVLNDEFRELHSDWYEVIDATRNVLKVDDYQAAVSAVLSGIGIGFLPRHLIQENVHRGELKTLACRPKLPSVPICVWWHKSTQNQTLVKIIQFLKNNREKLWIDSDSNQHSMKQEDFIDA